MQAPPTPQELDKLVRPLQLKDLRILCRARGLTPAGGKEQLEDRLKQHMMQTGNFSTVLPADGDAGGPPGAVPQGYAVAPQGYQQYTTGVNDNNYSRPGGQQNVGNFITDRPSSHVMAPPGGKSSLQLGGYSEAPPPQQYQQQGGYPQQQQGGYGSPMPGGGYGATSNDVRSGSLANNYSRPSGQQNVGNFITDRPSSKVLAPPGGNSQISFGDYNVAPAPQQQRRAPAPAPYGTSANMPPPQQHPYQAAGSAPYGSSAGMGQIGGSRATDTQSNNYSRPGGQQNVGNFITDRPSSRVLAPPGGKSQITFG
ncbi:hypothetical protein CHLRE_11g467576v5 [Chlamydomonas reinhardtii]|uniref:SAP domain-containing protein n=1 Tax=Chlamydomonas reinhardtii TaxID=3055 RepID=A0A2K3D7B9_CHLRE|nr:uncharacterized protein CHLRE_11g467576v5 [Chlamydomonas reinhardtii]PNW76426.1 hypothetical protein CHLRE_11g467576v5 [Chlamydomonas reinhardtii]